MVNVAVMHRRAFFGKAFAAIVGASFLSFDDSDGLYPFQREGIEYLRKDIAAATGVPERILFGHDFVGTGKVYAPYVPLYMTSLT